MDVSVKAIMNKVRSDQLYTVTLFDESWQTVEVEGCNALPAGAVLKLLIFWLLPRDDTTFLGRDFAEAFSKAYCFTITEVIRV